MFISYGRHVIQERSGVVIFRLSRLPLLAIPANILSYGAARLLIGVPLRLWWLLKRSIFIMDSNFKFFVAYLWRYLPLLDLGLYCCHLICLLFSICQWLLQHVRTDTLLDHHLTRLFDFLLFSGEVLLRYVFYLGDINLLLLILFYHVAFLILIHASNPLLAHLRLELSIGKLIFISEKADHLVFLL